ncbi:MAG: xanthine dehydrogenase FAD-binding subunit XdhB [Synergistaceae bacterium]|jgi:xanthine dehydrogenase FAD-binding subunit|nr:xanthine dehydrogenase FAD-binding subunit XdhB [Synergistaceae bacterium]
MFDFEAVYEAKSVAHAVELRVRHPEAKILAGGSDILIETRAGKLAGCSVISIFKLDELRGVSMDGDGTLRIGALTSFSHLTRDPLIGRCIKVLGEAAGTAGGPQLRNIGTIGGNVCNGVTSADTASTLMAWDAVMEYAGPRGVRRAPMREHYVKAGVVAIAPDEILTSILIPRDSYERCFGCYIKYAMRGAMDIATLGCSVNVRLSGDLGTVERMRAAYGVAAPVPVRGFSAESVANGQPVSPETINSAAAAALSDVNPRSSWRASRELRLQLAEELTRRAFRESVIRAGGIL